MGSLNCTMGMRAVFLASSTFSKPASDSRADTHSTTCAPSTAPCLRARVSPPWLRSATHMTKHKSRSLFGPPHELADDPNGISRGGCSYALHAG